MTAPLVDRSTTALVLVAIVLGLVLGAMTCAAGLADGTGHVTHAAVEPAVAASEIVRHPAEPGSHDHGTPATPSPTNAGGDASPVLPSAPAEGHPGMACLVPVDLRFLGPTVATTSDVCAPLAPLTIADGIGEVDPPVPRTS